jgi:alpha-tubulin suppressor-like RCC1 family protein
VAFAIGEDGELFSWGKVIFGTLGHGDGQNQPSPKRIEALRGVRVSQVSVGSLHVLALTEDGLVYAWGELMRSAILRERGGGREPLPKPVEALRGVRVASLVAAGNCCFAMADTGELWAWGSNNTAPLGHHEQMDYCPVPKPIEAFRGIKIDALAANDSYTIVCEDDGRVYAWGRKWAAKCGVLGLGPSVCKPAKHVLTPQRVPGLRVTCGP